MRILSIVLFLLVIVFGVAFAAINSQEVVVDFYLESTRLPLALLLSLTFAAGAILGLLLGLFLWLKSQASARLQRVTQSQPDAESSASMGDQGAPDESAVVNGNDVGKLPTVR